MKKTVLFGAVICVLSMFDTNGMDFLRAKEDTLSIMRKYATVPSIRECISRTEQTDDVSTLQTWIFLCVDVVRDYEGVSEDLANLERINEALTEASERGVSRFSSSRRPSALAPAAAFSAWEESAPPARGKGASRFSSSRRPTGLVSAAAFSAWEEWAPPARGNGVSRFSSSRRLTGLVPVAAFPAWEPEEPRFCISRRESGLVDFSQAKEGVLNIMRKYATVPSIRECISRTEQTDDISTLQTWIFLCVDVVRDYEGVSEDLANLERINEALTKASERGVSRFSSSRRPSALAPAAVANTAITPELRAQAEQSVRRTRQIEEDEAFARTLQKQESSRENGLPRGRGGLFGSLNDLIHQFENIIKANGKDFDVHAFDGLFVTNQAKVEQYLNDICPIERAMTLDEIKGDMLSLIIKATPELIEEHDLSVAHLERALLVLQSGSYSVLIPMFRQVYTVACRYAQNTKQSIVNSFLSNVNKFEGAECFPGFRNRIISDFCRLYRGNRPL